MIKLLISNDDFLDIYSDMQKQFPISELKAYDSMIKLSSLEEYKIFRCYIDELEVGYILAFISDGYILVDYLAIYEQYHSKGYGREVLGQLFKNYSYLKCCLFEVEKLNKFDIKTIRRHNFYKNLGCLDTEINYLYPSYNGAIPMNLLYYTLSSDINREDIKFFIKNMFNKIHYDVKSKDKIFLKIN